MANRILSARVTDKKKRSDAYISGPVTISCVECKEPFLSERMSHLTCSTACRKKRYQDVQRRRFVPKEVSCKFCKKKYLERRKWDIFCTQKCRDNWTKISKSQLANKDCLVCKNSFLPKSWRNTICSKECKKIRYVRAADISRKSRKGLCHWCGSPKLPNSSYLCEKHWFNRLAKTNKISDRNSGDIVRLLLEKQNYTCPYTGKKLVPGINASMDHVNPRSRFPEQVGLIENIEWIDIGINSAKRDKTKDEFISMCKLVASRFP